MAGMNTRGATIVDSGARTVHSNKHAWASLILGLRSCLDLCMGTDASVTNVSSSTFADRRSNA